MPLAAVKPKSATRAVAAVPVVSVPGPADVPTLPPKRTTPPEPLRAPLTVYRDDRRYARSSRVRLWRATMRDFTTTEFAVFGVLTIVSATTAEAIARRLGLPAVTVEQALQALEDVGLVQRDLPTWLTGRG